MNWIASAFFDFYILGFGFTLGMLVAMSSDYNTKPQPWWWTVGQALAWPIFWLVVLYTAHKEKWI